MLSVGEELLLLGCFQLCTNLLSLKQQKPLMDDKQVGFSIGQWVVIVVLLSL